MIGDLTVEARDVRLRDLWVDDRDPACTPLRGRLRWEELAYFEFAAIPIACQPGPQEALNGDYGLYRSAANATVLEEFDPAETSVGDTELFVINYVLCTQKCEDIPTLVTVVNLDRPLSVDGVEYDVLNLFEENPDDEGNPDSERAETYDVLASLQWASE